MYSPLFNGILYKDKLRELSTNSDKEYPVRRMTPSQRRGSVTPSPVLIDALIIGKPKVRCTIPEYIEMLEKEYQKKGNVAHYMDMIRSLKFSLHQKIDIPQKDQDAIDAFEKLLEQESKKRHDSKSSSSSSKSSAVPAPADEKKPYNVLLKHLESLNPPLALVVLDKLDFCGVASKANIRRVKATIGKIKPPTESSFPVSTIHALADEMVRHYTHRVNQMSLTLPARTPEEKKEYLKNYVLYQKLQAFTSGESRDKRFEDGNNFYAGITFEQERHEHMYEALELFYKKMFTEGDGFSFCYSFATRDFPLEFFKKNPQYALSRIEIFCLTVHYALNNAPVGIISKIAKDYYVLADTLQKDYRSQRGDTLSPDAQKVIAFFYYTKARFAYYIFTFVEEIVYASKTLSSIPTDPIAALKEFQNFCPEHNYPVAEWVEQITKLKGLPSAKKPKQIIPPQYGSYVHLSYEEQKANYVAMERSSLSVIKQAQETCLKRIIDIFSSLKECKDSLVGLETTIQKTCAWRANLAALPISQDLIELYNIFATNDTKELEKFRSRFIIPEEKKEEKKEEKPVKKVIRPPVIFKNDTPARPKKILSDAVKKIVEQDEKQKAESVAAAMGEEKKLPTSDVPKNPKKKKKKKKKIKPRVDVSTPSPAVTYTVKESKLPVSTNMHSISIKPKKLLKLDEGVSPSVFFEHILNPDSAIRIFDFLQKSPIAILGDKFVSGIQMRGSTIAYAAIYCLTGVYHFKPIDIDFFYSAQRFSMGIEVCLRQYQFTYQSSVKRKFTRYVCDNLKSPEEKEVRSELTLVPESALASQNSIPISRISAVADRDENKFYFIGLTPELQMDIINGVFRTDIPSLEPSALHESYFLMRFSNYYNKLVIQSKPPNKWHVEEKTKTILRVDEFLKPYLIKIKRYSEMAFQKEIGRLIEFYQSICLAEDTDETKLLIKDVFQPMMLAFFSVLIPAAKTKDINYAPLLTTIFLDLFREKKIPSKPATQKYFEWLRDIIKAISSVDELIALCCAEIRPTDSPLVMGGVFSSTLESPGLSSSSSLSSTPSLTL